MKNVLAVGLVLLNWPFTVRRRHPIPDSDVFHNCWFEWEESVPFWKWVTKRA